MPNQSSNPYASPALSSSQGAQETKPFVTRQKILYGGIGLIVGGLAAFTGSNALFVESPAAGGSWDQVVFVIDILAFVAFFAGWMSIAVCHWFPDPRRKNSWRRAK